MAERTVVLPGALEPERFFGRIEELRLLRREARSLGRGLGRSRVICARPGAGKSELLRQWHGQLFGEGEILPFWFPVPPDAEALGRDFTMAFALQAVAFRRRDPSLLARWSPPGDLVAGLGTWGEGGQLVAEALNAENGRAPGPGAPARFAALPHRFAALTGTRVLCLIDDADNLAATQPGSCWPEEATASRIAPAIFAVDDESQARRILGAAFASMVTLGRLAPLTLEASSRLARHLARTSGLELGEQAVAALAVESAGSPFYLGALVRAVAASPGAGPLEVARAAAAAVCEGELARYWIERLTGAVPDRRTRATALEILAFCLRQGEGGIDALRLAPLMLKPEAQIETALAGLERAGVARVDCNRVVVDDDPVLRDVLQALYRRELGQMAPGAVVASLAAEKARGAPAVRRRLWRETLRGALRDILQAWSGQQVPATLFGAAALRSGEGAAGVGEGDGATCTLPRVISVSAGRVGSGVSLPGLEVDALAWGLRADPGTAEADVAWVVRWLPGGAGGGEQIAQFAADVEALQTAGELPPSRLVRWAVLEAPLDPAGERAAAQARMSTSTRSELEALARLVGATTVLPLPLPAAGAAAALELEMVIPRVADVELVAARALEQLAENLAVEATVIGRLKVALVEACINAFEHGGARDGRVRLVFAVEDDRLRIVVENRGRPLAALPDVGRAEREAGGRGWGLTLIRELVDEVILEPREDGVSLVMVKSLGRGEHG